MSCLEILIFFLFCCMFFSRVDGRTTESPDEECISPLYYSAYSATSKKFDRCLKLCKQLHCSAYLHTYVSHTSLDGPKHRCLFSKFPFGVLHSLGVEFCDMKLSGSNKKTFTFTAQPNTEFHLTVYSHINEKASIIYHPLGYLNVLKDDELLSSKIESHKFEPDYGSKGNVDGPLSYFTYWPGELTFKMFSVSERIFSFWLHSNAFSSYSHFQETFSFQFQDQRYQWITLFTISLNSTHVLIKKTSDSFVDSFWRSRQSSAIKIVAISGWRHIAFVVGSHQLKSFYIDGLSYGAGWLTASPLQFTTAPIHQNTKLKFSKAAAQFLSVEYPGIEEKRVIQDMADMTVP